MKIKNRLGFRLFVIFSLFLVGFVCLLTYLQVFIIGRMYTTSQYVQQREKELYNLIPEFIYENTYFDKYKGTTDARYSIGEIERFETANNINLLVFDGSMNTKYITSKAQRELGSTNISYIQDNVRWQRLRAQAGTNASFRVYGKYGLPTKYVAVVFDIQSSPNSRNFVVAVIPEVFTASTSNILVNYISYIVLFALLITFALSGFFSYIVARPISEINKSASRMAQMDFSEKCKIERNDEIGNLASTLNYLSGSLESTLNKLYDANDKLKKDLNLQKELDMLRKDFIAAITHEFKTPITLIRGYGESIKDNVASGKDREFAIDTIINETEKVDKLVNELLDLSSLETIDYRLNISSFSVDGLLNEIAKKYEKVMEGRKVRFSTEIDKTGITVRGDSYRIEQVITNFLNNAIAHTPQEKEITLSLKDMGSYVMASVQNQGEQIKDDEIKRIWEKFYRVEKSRNKKYGGSGLGLAISSAILKLHNSSFGAENTSDGVRFYFTLEKS